MKKFWRTHILFAITGILIFITSLLYLVTLQRSTLDINVHDTYFVIQDTHVVIVMLIPFLFFFLVYFAFYKFKRPLGNYLGLAHYLISTCAVLLISLSSFSFWPREPSRYYTTSDVVFGSSLFEINEMLTMAALLFLVGQIVLLTNIILTLARRKQPTN